MSHEPPPEGDTIVAISTPPGRGGIGVVRISGPRSIAIASSLFRPAAPAAGSGRSDGAGGNGVGDPGRTGAAAATPRILFGRFGSRAEETIDHGYLVTFDPPRTFTGEPTAELWAHGSVAVLRSLVQEAVARGARPATPGEFTLRAFLNGRIDVTQAEAIRDLIEARTSFQAQVAHDQVEGRISRAVDRLKDRLVEVVARVEAAIEFSEEAEAERFAPEGGILQAIRTLVSDMERLAGTYERGRRVREGASVAIVGAPNAGKSSLFNRLLEEDRAIVTPVAGTTRDLIEETLDLGGIPVRLTDTAGIHEPRDEADAEAVRRARAALAGADLRLVALDWSRDLREGERAMLRDLGGAPAIVVFNKCDRPRGVALDQVLSLRRRHAAFEVSARSGEGIGDLRRRLAEAIAGGPAVTREEMFLTNVRHRDLVTKAAAALRRAETAAREGAGEEYLVLDLKDGLDSLGEITGAVGIQAIHETIFRSFCIGK